MKTILITLAVVLTGCASTPPPTLADEGYDPHAIALVKFQRCGVSGFMPLEMAAQGKNHMDGMLTGVAYDKQRMQTRFQYYHDSFLAPTEQQCRSLAIDLMSKQQKVAAQNQRNKENGDAWKEVADSLKPNSSQQAYCNQIGTQTFCRNY